MAEIKIINKVSLSQNGLVINGSKQLAHLRQGELDGACAVYSMMMCLVIEKIIKRNVITDVPHNLRRNTSDGRLVNHFLEKQGMVVNGYELNVLQGELQSAFKRKVKTKHYNSEDSNITDEVVNSLEENHPVEIGFTYIGGKGHAVVVIGYQDGGDKTTFYCLDPGYPMNECQMWNNALIIDRSSTAMYSCINLREDRKVMIDEAMVFYKNKS